MISSTALFIGATLPLAFVLDLLIGDPETWPHPVRLMGAAITYAEPRFRKLPFSLKTSGCLFALFLISGTFFISLLLIRIAYLVHPLCALVLQIIMMYYCISVRSLEQAAMGVERELVQNGLAASKNKLRLIVGREVEPLDTAGVSRAAVETVAENFVDGVMSPMVFGIFFGVPAAMAFKMISTLDSMVGYKNDRYMEFGMASARIDDVANFVPARLGMGIIALAAGIIRKGNGTSSLKMALHDGNKHASPNSGIPEAAFAGALGIRLGGPNIYHGKRVDKPWIGEELGDAGSDHIKKACDLMQFSSLIACLVLWGVRLVIG